MYAVKCPKCKRTYEFQGLPPKYCPECLYKEENDYRSVREFVKANPGVNIYTTSQKTGIPLAKILQYLREERLEVSNNSTSFLKCSACGRVINTGVYCDDCKRRYGDNANAVISKGSSDPAKMRISAEKTPLQ